MSAEPVRPAATAALATLTQYEPASDETWRTRSVENRAEVVLRRVPTRLEAIATLLPQLTLGSERERMAALWYLQDALKAEARALRVAVIAVDPESEGFIRPAPEPKRGKRRAR